MQHFSSEQVKLALYDTIDSLYECRNDFFKNPQTDFTRTKKISFRQTMLFPVLAGSDNIATELLDFFGEDRLPLPSAMIQRRNQVKPEAFRELFSSFTQKFTLPKSFHGYQLVACDGSRLNLPYNPSDPDSFIQYIEGRKGINQLHLNSYYDILNDVFLDVELQNIPQMNEKKAFVDFLDKNVNLKQKRISLCDRGYASYNVIAHAIHNNQLFLIRSPESFVKNLCPQKEHWMEKDCEDEIISITIGRRKTYALQQLENYHFLRASRTYDFLEAGSSETDCLKFRVLKFPISENNFEYIITNLPSYAFSSATIKKLYHLRWNVETAFRHLKYAANLVHIHSVKKDLLLQEIYGKLTLYNFSSLILLAIESPQLNTDKYAYKINHTQLLKICVRFLRGMIQNIVDLIKKFRIPVRPDRKFARNLRRQSADTLNYR